MSLTEDLADRVNPERSRRFSRLAFEEGLLRIRKEAERIEKEFAPFRPLRIAVVGTNGKGSTAFALEQCFRYGASDFESAGKRRDTTGLYTSPHLLRFTERIRVDGDPASVSDLEEEYANLVRTTDRENLSAFTYFELLTLLAFRLFLSRHLPVQIFEAGLGGRLDATKIARADAVLFTNVGLDHTDLLGHTRKQILREKLGILDERSRLLYSADPVFSQDAIRKCLQESKNSGPEIIRFAAPPRASYTEAAVDFARFVYRDLRLRLMAGDIFQNLPQALHGLRSLPDRFAPLPPPGRFEIRKNERRTFIFDNAHNPAAVFRFLQDFRRRFPEPTTGAAGAVLALLADRRTAPLRKILRAARIRPVVQICREGFAPHDHEWVPLFEKNNPAKPDGGEPLLEPVLHALREGPLSECPIILFLGSHRLYDLFDRVSREERAR